VLQQVSFRLPRGTISAILGTNGAGKTTLLKCLNRILKPQKGTVYLKAPRATKKTDSGSFAPPPAPEAAPDRPPPRDAALNLATARAGAIARHFAYVPQQHPRTGLTVYDTVLLGRKPFIKWAPSQRDGEIVERAIIQMGLQKLVLRPLDELSGGELQKVILARALAQQPQILLLDEPTANLDLKNQLEVMSLIKKAAQENEMTVLISIHDLNLALRYAQQFLLLKNGVIRTCGERREITSARIRDVYGVNVVLGEVKGYPVAIPVGAPTENTAGTPTENTAGTPTENTAGTPTENTAGAPTENTAGAPTENGD
jgi:iron complex transport system ATP-binding protein